MLVRRGIMTDPTPLGPWVRRFLLEHLVGERNLARHTQRSYRDALVLLLPFIADHVHQSVDQLQIDDLTAEHVRLFLHDLEQRRHCRVTTRNQRLAAIHALARFIGQRSPEYNESSPQQAAGYQEENLILMRNHGFSNSSL